MTTTRPRPTTPYDRPSLAPEVLAQIEDRMAKEISRLQRTVQRTVSAEFHRGGDHLDVTALRQGHEANQALRARCVDGLTEWIGALSRLRASPERFGVCEGCQQPIPWARLDVLPTARRCVGC